MTDTLQTERENGQRKAPVRDFHSSRVTWITLAPAAGVPLELAQRVTGHRTAEVVMKHYFRPGRKDFREAILKAIPKMLAENGGQRPVRNASQGGLRLTGYLSAEIREGGRAIRVEPGPTQVGVETVGDREPRQDPGGVVLGRQLTGNDPKCQ